LRQQVAKEISPIATPREIHVVPELPKTRSGKIMPTCCATWPRAASSATHQHW
jgi:acyl-coenzyme A synthetase/AMP-(fatty) acid ligase